MFPDPRPTPPSIAPTCSIYVLVSRRSGALSATAEQCSIAEASDKEVDDIIAEFDGDYRQAIRALLHDLTQFAALPDGTLAAGDKLDRLYWLEILG